MNGEKLSVISSDVEKLIDSIDGEMIVCRQYQLLKLGKSFTLEGKRERKNRTVIQKDWFFSQNSQVDLSGLLYVYDHDQTLKYYEDSAKQRAARKKQKDLKDATANSFINAMETIQKGALSQMPKVEEVKLPKVELREATKKEKEEIEEFKENDSDQTDGVPNENWTKEEIHSWIDFENEKGAGIEYKKTLGVATLLSTVVNPYLETLKTGE